MSTVATRGTILNDVNIRPEIQTMTFSVDSFRITDTRSRHNDTDFVSCTLLVRDASGNGTPQTLNKSMGDVNNGAHAVNLSFANVAVPVGGSIVFNYLIVNSGHKSESDVDQALEKAGSALAQKGLVAGGTALGTAIFPGLGTILGMVGGWLAGEIGNIMAANCDGPVAAEQITLTQAQLMQETANGPYGKETKHPGTDSATGCGSNSMYYVTWHIARGITEPVA